MTSSQPMLFAINYSRPAAELAQAGRLPIDRFKCPNWPDMVAEAQPHRPVAVHFDLKAGSGKLTRMDWEPVQTFLDQTGTPHVNVHLETSLKDLPDVPPGSNRPEHCQRVLERMLADVQAAVDRFGAERVIAENVPYRPGSRPLAACADPQIIRTVIETTGCGLLLDISHARISAHSLGMDERAYLTQLPVEHLREMHFTGVQQVDGWLQDHQPALEADWQALDWVLERIRCGDWPRPWMLAFEYGGVGGKFTEQSNPEVIETQGNRIYAALHTL